MCGIIGYNGSKQAAPEILTCLKRIEYRGYDSAGMALLPSRGKIASKKTVGGVDALSEVKSQLPRAHMGIGHTRWATHGKPTKTNAHPHKSKNFTLVHNGIIENHEELRSELSNDFASDTDTEVLVWLIEKEFAEKKNVRSALVSALRQVRGTFGIVLMHRDTPNVLYVARRSSPIVIASLDDGHLVASDITALPKRSRHVTHLEDDQFAVVTPDSLSVYNLEHDIVQHKKEPYIPSEADTDKAGQEHFMLKEILEQPVSAHNTLRGRIDSKQQTAVLGGLDLDARGAKNITRMLAVGCGTAHYSSVLASYLLEDITDVPMDTEIASEFVYRGSRHRPEETFTIAVSQSGETADTIAAINKLRENKYMMTYGIVNVVGSNISRITDGGTYLHCGPEVAVASTKAFTSQVIAQLLVGLKLNTLRGQPVKNNETTVEALRQLPGDIEKALSIQKSVEQVAKHLHAYDKAMYLGRNALFPVALEGALKYKEITYTPTNAYPAGEMKHGPLALIDDDMLIVYLAHEDSLFDKSLSNLQEIDARGGQALVITDSTKLAKQRKNAVLVPKSSHIGTPLVMNIALQLFAYYVAKARGLDIDKPRNLAKSVTVE